MITLEIWHNHTVLQTNKSFKQTKIKRSNAWSAFRWMIEMCSNGAQCEDYSKNTLFDTCNVVNSYSPVHICPTVESLKSYSSL